MRTLLFAFLLLATTAFAHHTDTDVRDELTGQWVGTSICTEPRGACHDETASYRFTKHADDEHKVTASMNKIVNGEEEVMGITEFTVDAKARTIVADYQSRRGLIRWSFSWKGKEMTGTLINVADGRVLRNIAVKRQ
jgi:hypothetical protein